MEIERSARLARPSPSCRPRASLVAYVWIAAAALVLSGCSERDFRDAMATIALAMMLLALGAICFAVLNLVVIGGGVTTLAMNVLGSPTRRSRNMGFLFGGLNLAAGLTGTILTLASMYLSRDTVAAAMHPDPSTPDASNVLVGAAVALFMSVLALALGIGGIAAAARAKPKDAANSMTRPDESP